MIIVRKSRELCRLDFIEQRYLNDRVVALLIFLLRACIMIAVHYGYGLEHCLRTIQNTVPRIDGRLSS